MPKTLFYKIQFELCFCHFFKKKYKLLKIIDVLFRDSIYQDKKNATYERTKNVFEAMLA